MSYTWLMAVPGQKFGSLDSHINIYFLLHHSMLSNSGRKEVELTSQWRSGKTAVEKLSYEDYSEYDRQNKVKRQTQKREGRPEGRVNYQ